MKSIIQLLIAIFIAFTLQAQPKNKNRKLNSEEHNSYSENTIKIVSTPNPSLFPLLLAMADEPGLQVELIPVGKSSELVAQLNSKADGEISMTFVAANQMVKASVPDLRLLEIVYWSGFYELTSIPVKSFQDLKGEKLIVSGPVGSGKEGGPDLIFKAALKRESLSVDDFNVSYMPVNKGTETIMSGEADAILLVEPASSGLIMMSKMKAGVKLENKLNIQGIFSGYTSWDTNQLPLGGLSMKISSLNDESKKQQIEKLRKAYLAASNKMENISFSDARKISGLLERFYGNILENNIPPIVIRKASVSGNYVYRSDIRVESIKQDLNSFIEEILGEGPSEKFYE